MIRGIKEFLTKPGSVPYEKLRLMPTTLYIVGTASVTSGILIGILDYRNGEIPWLSMAVIANGVACYLHGRSISRTIRNQVDTIYIQRRARTNEDDVTEAKYLY